MMRYLRRTDLMFLIDTRWIYHPTILRMSEVFDGHRPELWMIRWRSVISNIYDIILEYRDREREIYYHNKPESHIYIYIMYIYICIYIYIIIRIIHNIHGRYGGYNQLLIRFFVFQVQFWPVPLSPPDGSGPPGCGVPRFTKAKQGCLGMFFSDRNF